MKPLERMGLVLTEAEALLEDIKTQVDTITVAEAREIYSSIREAEGWLLSARKLLEPPGVL
jgi:hypothetical protein